MALTPAENVRLTNLGKTVEVVGGLVNAQPPNTRILLLDVNLADLDKCRNFESGSWCMIVHTEVVTWPGPPIVQRVIPLQATIRLGAGGAHHVIEVDAHPGFAIQLPGNTVTCELWWDRLPAQNMVPPGFFDWVIPDLVRVSGTIFRGTVVSNAHRTFIMPQDNATPGLVGINTEGLIPPFSRTCMLYGADQIVTAPYDPASFIQLTQQVGGVGPIQNFTGTQLLNLKNAARRIPVTGQMARWQVRCTVGVALPVLPVFLDFEIVL